MVHTCVFCGEKFSAGNGRTFHTFPLNQPEILQSWLNNMRLGANFVPNKFMKLCSDHFEKVCLKKPGVNVTLAEKSIPTIFGTPKSACVYCRAIKESSNPRTFHSFPRKNAELRQKWMAKMGSENCIVGSRSLICSDHFEKSCFRSSGHSHGQLLRLRDTAVPTIFTPKRSQEDPVFELARRSAESTEELPAAKRMNIDSESMVDTISSSLKKIIESENTSDCSNQQSTPSTPRRVTLTQHDHHYEDTPRMMRNKLCALNQKLRKMAVKQRVYKQHIVRLHKKVESLKDIIRKFGLPTNEDALQDDDDDDDGLT